jgi:uncharacterized protein
MATLHQITLPIFTRHLTGLAGCMKKAQAVYAEKKYDESTLLSYRLFPDMFSFARQVQAATDHARNCAALLGGVDAPKYEMNEKSLADLIARVEKTLAFIATVKPDGVNAAEDKTIVVKVMDREMNYKGIDLALNRALPNFYFHATTAYNILRHNGVQIGKKDFMGAA